MDFIREYAVKHGQIDVLEGVSGKKLTTFGSVGAVSLVLCPKNAEAVADITWFMEKNSVPRVVIGRGSNVVISDKGCTVPLISLKHLNAIRVEEDVIYAGAGVTLPQLAREAREAGLGGIEYMCGIPASFGGAIKMNAGAYGTETADKLLFVDILNGDTVKRVPASGIGFGYRHSGISGVILGAAVKLTRADVEEIEAEERRLALKRRLSQPLAKSAGSVFKRVDGVSAGYYVDGAGLKGAREGGAEISPVHANFIINKGWAKTRDFTALAELAQAEVYKKYGVKLQKEVLYFGDEILR